jgi:hypothetical protein
MSAAVMLMLFGTVSFVSLLSGPNRNYCSQSAKKQNGDKQVEETEGPLSEYHTSICRKKVLGIKILIKRARK